jgi:acid stress-induced BolA-like protein IbaG/YrbA
VAISKRRADYAPPLIADVRRHLMSAHAWSDQQFDEMSWHDNAVHALRIVEGIHGAGELVLDLDYILEWVKCEGDNCEFKVVPATLTFKGVTNLRISLDYATPTAALGPFSIHAIERRTERRQRYEAQLWKILVNWPVGEISFEALGFEQRSTGDPVHSAAMCLNPSER